MKKKELFFSPEKLKSLMLSHNLNLTEISFRTGIEVATLSRMASGNSSNPAYSNVYRLAEFFAVPVEYFMPRLLISLEGIFKTQNHKICITFGRDLSYECVHYGIIYRGKYSITNNELNEKIVNLLQGPFDVKVQMTSDKEVLIESSVKAVKIAS